MGTRERVRSLLSAALPRGRVGLCIKQMAVVIEPFPSAEPSEALAMQDGPDRWAFCPEGAHTLARRLNCKQITAVLRNTGREAGSHPESELKTQKREGIQSVGQM